MKAIFFLLFFQIFLNSSEINYLNELKKINLFEKKENKNQLSWNDVDKIMANY